MFSPPSSSQLFLQVIFVIWSWIVHKTCWKGWGEEVRPVTFFCLINSSFGSSWTSWPWLSSHPGRSHGLAVVMPPHAGIWLQVLKILARRRKIRKLWVSTKSWCHVAYNTPAKQAASSWFILDTSDSTLLVRGLAGVLKESPSGSFLLVLDEEMMDLGRVQGHGHGLLGPWQCGGWIFAILINQISI